MEGKVWGILGIIAGLSSIVTAVLVTAGKFDYPLWQQVSNGILLGIFLVWYGESRLKESGPQ